MALQSQETEKGKFPVPKEAKVDTAKIITGIARDDSRDVSPCQARDLF